MSAAPSAHPAQAAPVVRPVSQAARPDARQDLRDRTPEAPSVPDRPRAGAAATTGQLPVARTRSTGAGPHDTVQMPVVRAAPRPPVTQQTALDPAVGSAAPVRAAAPIDPPRRRLRVEPPAAARTALAPAPSAPAPAPAPLRPRGADRTRPDARTAPLSRPVPRRTPPPPAPPAEPLAAHGRRPVRAAIALLAVAGLVAISALPSVGAGTGGAPPVAGVHLDDDLQQFHVADDVTSPDAQSDPMSGSTPVVAPSWVVPLRGELRDGFGPRLAQPVAGVSLFHRGQDIGGGCGAPIHAAAAGTVVTSRWWGTYGNWTLIDHGGGVETGYAHQSRMVVTVGQHVDVGQVIGYEGNTGASTGCHLHLEVHLAGVAVNPVPFFAAKGIPLGR